MAPQWIRNPFLPPLALVALGLSLMVWQNSGTDTLNSEESPPQVEPTPPAPSRERLPNFVPSYIAEAIGVEVGWLTGDWDSNHGLVKIRLHEPNQRIVGLVRLDGFDGVERRFVGRIRGQELIGLWSHDTGTTRCPVRKFGRWYWGRIRLSFDSATSFSGVRGICADEPTEPWVAQKRSNLDGNVLTVE